jgi:hypothetical protein
MAGAFHRQDRSFRRIVWGLVASITRYRRAQSQS